MRTCLLGQVSNVNESRSGIWPNSNCKTLMGSPLENSDSKVKTGSKLTFRQRNSVPGAESNGAKHRYSRKNRERGE